MKKISLFFCLFFVVVFVYGQERKLSNSGSISLDFPADGQTLTKAEENQAINFRWTPILPKPNSIVKYRVVVFDVLKDQTLREASKRGEVLFEKEIENQVQMRLGGPRWVPRDPPVNSNQANFGWYVEARDSKGNLLISSESAGFRVEGQKRHP